MEKSNAWHLVMQAAAFTIVVGACSSSDEPHGASASLLQDSEKEPAPSTTLIDYLRNSSGIDQSNGISLANTGTRDLPRQKRRALSQCF
ncbi:MULTISPECIES: hypothetical protein [unclassified Corynebacterium]|uniref:hypothetical protein n=1 Tax=unclassified Corynebacterium TaxID=2624378 RepID=UPI002167472B|nr:MULTISPECIES: hypothetical protein [unclassified Corynebacterium]MCS4490014.1 hypothetical protein [Corynebacterium sp. ES2775-CONJ]MCS4531728.1 hypothetical protein [Corynebacterium sp. ES2730-CONJ]